MTRPNVYYADGKPHYVFCYATANVSYVDRTGKLSDDDVWVKAVRVGRRRGLGDPVDIYRQQWRKVDPTTGGKLSWIAATYIRDHGPAAPAQVRDAVVAALPHVRDDPWLKGKVKKLLRLNKVFRRVRAGVYGLSAHGKRVVSGDGG
jgi:hypothetical protein